MAELARPIADIAGSQKQRKLFLGKNHGRNRFSDTSPHHRTISRVKIMAIRNFRQSLPSWLTAE
jgi:hypothetical protein